MKKKSMPKKKPAIKKKTKKKAGRPPFKLNEKEQRQLQSLAQCGCTNEEIEAVMEHSYSTMYHNYGEVIKRGRNGRNAMIRHKQYQVAVHDGNVTMLIWLGKQYLSQVEPSKIDIPALEKLTGEYSKLETHEIIDRIIRLFESEGQSAFASSLRSTLEKEAGIITH